MIYANFQCQTSFASAVDVLAAWGLKTMMYHLFDVKLEHSYLNTSIRVMQLLYITINQLGVIQMHFFPVNKRPNLKDRILPIKVFQNGVSANAFR